MGYFKEVEGDLIELSLQGKFDVCIQGCNCQNTMSAGLAVPMKEAFGTDAFPMELTDRGDYNKLGQIDYHPFFIQDGEAIPFFEGKLIADLSPSKYKRLYVVNCYTQYNYGRNHADGDAIPLNYTALEMCLDKINHIFKGKHIGAPLIGCGLASGNPEVIIPMMKSQLRDCDVTLVHYLKK